MTGGSKGEVSASKLIQQEMQQKTEKVKREQNFQTKSMRDLAKLKRQRVYPFAVIRFQFSDGTALYGRFRTGETCSAMKGVVESCLENVEGSELFLYVTPPRKELDDFRSIQDEGLVPSSKVYVGFKGDGSNVRLKEDCFDRQVAAAGMVVKGENVMMKAESR